MDVGRASAELAGRVLLAHLFLISGLHKIGGYAVTQGYMEQAGLPGALLPLAILLELGGGVLLIIGWETRWAALALGIFTALAAIFFHRNFQDPNQLGNWMKNWAIVGGMLVVLGFGPGPFSVDRLLERRRHSGGA